MRNRRAVLIALLIAGLLAGGCQTAPVEPAAVCEYPPGSKQMQFTADQPGVFSLVHWATTQGSSPDVALNSEVNRVFVERGSLIGFRQDDHHAVAFAGPTTIPIDQGKYSWVALNTEPLAGDQRPPVAAMVVGTMVALSVWPFVIVWHSIGLWLDDMYASRHRN
jgi:hypothetical protein